MNKLEDSNLLAHPKQEEITMTGSVTMCALGVLSWDNDSKANKKLDFLIYLDEERAHLLIH